jgi:sterol desaturase/sphingolipid hydroxylase (fatty acid hydroxylase superfamily)
MEGLLRSLNDLTPVIAIGSLAIFMTLERWLPYFEHGAGRGRQRWHNLGMVAIAFLLNATLGGLTLLPVVWADANQFGLMYRMDVWPPLAIVVGVFVIDLGAYALHVTMHSVRIFWRFHRVHHADVALDASSGLRLHPFEFVLLTSVIAITMVLAGAPMASIIIYNTLALPLFVMNHSNMKYPAWYERWGSLFLVTPDWHRVHHSSHQPETDSRYGCVFSIWDRLFGTAARADSGAIQFGLERFRGPQEQTVWQLLKMPFRSL